MGEPVLQFEPVKSDTSTGYKDGDDGAADLNYIKITIAENGFIGVVVYHGEEYYQQYIFATKEEVHEFVKEFI